MQENNTGNECLKYFQSFKKKVEKEYVKKLIDRFDLDLNKKISDYSKGNKQKLAIILAFMHKPKLLILDEPTSGLDPLNQQEFYNTVLETKKWGATTFFSTHLLAEADKMCDRVGIIKEGKLLKIENIDEFKNKNIHEIFIETNESIPLSLFQEIGATKVKRTTSGYHFVSAGKSGQMIKKIAAYDILDLKIQEPTLEEIFMHYYAKKEENHD